MIVRIHSDGKSFKGAAAYLTHDPKAQTAERVAWTHTLNLAHDHIPSAVDEMLWTARNAELLKQEAGIRAGGRVTENLVKHFSLNWDPEDRPTPEHMLETAEDFLHEMKWHEHQAIVIAHDDKEHAHVHVLLNAVHAETGLRLDDNFEYRRAQAWALDYERQQGNIRCENRLRDEEEREDGPTRPAWMAFKNEQKKFEENEKILIMQELNFDIELENAPAAEWKKLKEIQRDERLTFFAEGKLAFSELRLSIYREVREEFREQWADYYAVAKNDGDLDKLKEMKAALISEQKALLEERRDTACAELRDSRKELYREFLADQRDIRHGLHARQDAGLDSLNVIDEFKTTRLNGGHDDRQSSNEPDRNYARAESEQTRTEFDTGTLWSHRSEPRNGMRSGTAVTGDVAYGFATVFLDLFSRFVDGGDAPTDRPKRQAEPEFLHKDSFAYAADEARRKADNDAELEERRRREERDARSQ